MAIGARPRPLSSLRTIPQRPNEIGIDPGSPASGKHDDPRVTIVIPVYGKWMVTERCLRALRLTEARWRASVVVIDDASPDDTVEQLARFPWVLVKELPNNVGFPHACNEGAALAQTEFLLILNNDTEPLPGFLDALLDLADGDPAIAVVGSRLVYPDGRLQEAGAIVWRDGTGANYGRDRSPDDPRYLHVRDVDYCSAASILVRSEFFREVGGFDGRYSRGYYEDTDLAFTARSRSRRVVYQPASVVIHLEGASHGVDPSIGVKRFQEINRHVFVEKWRRELEQQPQLGEVPLRVAASRGSRRSILFLDYAILTPNHDSGSRRSWEMLQICRDLGYETVFAAEHGDPFSPDATKLRQLGTMVLGRKHEIRQFIAEDGDWLACVFVARADVAEQWQPWLASRHPDLPVIFDTVDLHHIREATGARLLGSRSSLRRARRTEEVELALVRRCAATLVVSETERTYLLERLPGAPVVTLSNIHHPTTDVTPFRSRRGLLFVGSFLHDPNTDGVAWFLRDVWHLIAPSIREDGLEIVGQEPSRELIEAAAPGAIFLGWVPDITRQLRNARVSIAPLRFGAGIKGKVGEAWSYGLPVVGTTTAMDGMVEPESPAHLVADSPTDFARLIEHVYGDEQLWQAASDAGRALVAERLAPGRAADTLREVLARVGRLPAAASR